MRAGLLTLSHTAEVTPSERSDELTGLLTISAPADAAALGAALLAAAPGARVELGRATVPFGAPVAGATAGPRVPAQLPGGATATLIFGAVTATGGGGTSETGARALWAIAAGLGAMAAAALVAGTRRRSEAGLLARPETTGVGSRPDAAEARSGTGADERGGSSARSEALAEPLASTAPTPAPSDTIGSRAAFAPTLTPPAGAQNAGHVERRIGRYALVRPLGQGGMAEVFLARAEGEAGFGKLVAFKVLQPAFAARQPVVDLFLDEARLVAGLDHPNIVQTYDLGRAGDRYFIAMEYVDGSDLARLIEAIRERGARVPVPCALAILCRICDGLHAAHTAVGPDGQPLGLIHRDVKSANVFVSRAGAVKVGDFGIAKATHAVRLSRTEVGQVKGTPGYMAPEQRLGEDVDGRADVYGVGAIAYELLSGAPINLDLVTLAARGTAGWPHLPPLARVRPDVPPELDAVVMQSLAYDRARRPADCAALERAFRRIAAITGIADDKEIGAWARRTLERDAAGGPEPASNARS